MGRVSVTLTCRLCRLAPLLAVHNKPGSWPYLVIQGGLEVSPRFPVRRRVGKTAPSLGESFSISRVEVLILSTSPNVAKSQDVLTPFVLASVMSHDLEEVAPVDRVVM
jgi:hypothetical protein